MALLVRALALAAAVALAMGPPAPAAPTGAGFELRHARVKPAVVYFDGERQPTVRFAFGAERRLDLVVRIVRVGGNPVRRYRERALAPGKFHEVSWDGRRGNRGVPADGTYEFRIGPAGHRGAAAGRFAFHDHVFPVQGAHSYGDRFGEPRSGGRVHEGQDLPAGCGTRAGRRAGRHGRRHRLQRRALRLLRADRRPRHRARLLLRPPAGADAARRRRAGAHRRADRRGRQDRATLATSSASCTSSSGPPATTTARPRIPLPPCCGGTPSRENKAPQQRRGSALPR